MNEGAPAKRATILAVVEGAADLERVKEVLRRRYAAGYEHAIDIWHVLDGLLAEHWDELNTLEFFQQIGAVPAVTPPVT